MNNYRKHTWISVLSLILTLVSLIATSFFVILGDYSFLVIPFLGVIIASVLNVIIFRKNEESKMIGIISTTLLISYIILIANLIITFIIINS